MTADRWAWLARELPGNIAAAVASNLAFYAAIYLLMYKWPWARVRLASRRHSAYEHSRADFVREIKHCFVPEAILATIVFFLLGSRGQTPFSGAFALRWGSGFWLLPRVIAQTALILAAYEVFYFFLHRALHAKPLFRRAHSVHHRSKQPTVFSGTSVNLLEALGFYTFFASALFLPLEGLACVLAGAVVKWGSLSQHSGHELIPAVFRRKAYLHWLNSTRFHQLHHSSSFRHNYGFQTAVLDRLFGTVDPAYDAYLAAAAAPRAPTDWLAAYNALLVAKGEDARVGAMHVRTADLSYEETVYTHTAIDGVGAMAHVLRTRLGYRDEDLPRLSGRKPPPLRRLLPELLRFVWHELKPTRPIPWREVKPEAPYQTFGKAFHLFSAAETSALTGVAKAGGANLHAFLLHELNLAVTELLTKDAAVARWHIPVAVGGVPGRGDEHKNRMSNFLLEVTPSATPAAIAAAMARHFRRGSHFAAAFMLAIGDYRLGRGVVPGKVERDYRRPRASERITGTFSSLGAWPRRGVPDRDPAESFVAFGNVSLKNPICALNLLWHGQLTVSLQLHSSVSPRREQVDQLMARWVSRLQAAVA